MNDWGVPVWTEPAEYDDSTKWKFVRWRWEFIRRNLEYRAQALNFFCILEAQEAAATHLRCTQSPEARERFTEIADRQQHAFEAFWQRWGYVEVLDPRISEYSDDTLKTLARDGFNLMEGSPSSEAGRSVMRLKIGEVAIRFDLDKPLQAQIAIAAKSLKCLQKKRHGKEVREPTHPDKWLLYLRALDARAGGASLREIAGILPETMARHTPEAARDVLNQAEKLASRF